MVPARTPAAPAPFCANHAVVPSWAAGQPRLISSLVSRASAALLAIGGVALLFAADDILPRIIPGFPEAGAWVGQLLAAPWLGVAALNWLNRSFVIGGITGAPSCSRTWHSIS